MRARANSDYLRRSRTPLTRDLVLYHLRTFSLLFTQRPPHFHRTRRRRRCRWRSSTSASTCHHPLPSGRAPRGEDAKRRTVITKDTGRRTISVKGHARSRTGAAPISPAVEVTSSSTGSTGSTGPGGWGGPYTKAHAGLTSL